MPDAGRIGMLHLVLHRSARGRVEYREVGWREAKCQNVIEKASFWHRISNTKKCPTRRKQAKQEKAMQSGVH